MNTTKNITVVNWQGLTRKEALENYTLIHFETLKKTELDNNPELSREELLELVNKQLEAITDLDFDETNTALFPTYTCVCCGETSPTLFDTPYHLCPDCTSDNIILQYNLDKEVRNLKYYAKFANLAVVAEALALHE